MLNRFKGSLKRLNEEIEKINGKWEFFIIFLLAALLVSMPILGMGTITSGVHLVDDHEFLRWTYQFRYENANIFDIFREWFWRDLYWRYRPLYYFLRISSCYVFGDNLVAYSALKALEILFTIIILYYCARTMGEGVGKVYCVLFAFMSMVGYQSAVWWKLGPQESFATLLFVSGFFCMLKYLKGNQKGWMTGSILLFLLMANYKESYIILIPFLMLYVLYFEMNDSGKGEVTLQEIWRCIKRKLGYLIALSIVFIVPVFIIVFYVGTDRYGSVGFESGMSIMEYVDGLGRSLKGDLKWYKRFGIFFFMILLTYWDELKKLWKEILLTVAFLFPQIVLYGRQGIGERYVLPGSIGFAFFFVYVIPKWKPLSGKRRFVYVTGILLCLAAHGRVMLREADYFRYRGESITSAFEAINKMKKEDSNVLACFRPNEEGNMTIDFWLKLHDFDNVYYWTEEDQTITKVSCVTSTYPEEYYQKQNYDDMDIIVMYNKEDRHWVCDMSMDLTEFQKIPCGTLTMYVRNGSVEDIVRPQIDGLRIHF